MLVIYYKYVPRMFVIKKTYKDFLNDFLNKHFKAFLHGNLGLYVSPFYDSAVNMLLLSFDCDKKQVGNNMGNVIDTVKSIDKMLKHECDIVTTQNGFHVISRHPLIIKNTKKVVDINHYLKAKLSTKLPAVDWNGSVKIVPFGRLGKADSGVYMNPIDIKHLNNADRIKNMTPIQLNNDPEYWTQYITNNLRPDTKKRLKLAEILL